MATSSTGSTVPAEQWPMTNEFIILVTVSFQASKIQKEN
jgi:hypothetical protein